MKAPAAAKLAPDRAVPRRNRLAIGAAILVAAAVLFGGGGSEAQLANGILNGLGALLLGACAARHFSVRPLPREAAAPLWLAVAVLVVVAAQLVPLPASLWSKLPGRELASAVAALIGTAGQARPLSLDPEATRSAAAALLLPVAVMLATVQSDPRGRLLIVRALVAAAAVSAVLAAAQGALGTPEWLAPYGNPEPGVASGVFANSNHQAHLMVAALVATGLLISLRGPRGRSRGRTMPPLEWALLPLFILLAIAAYSRAGLVLLVVGAAAAAMLASGRIGAARWIAIGIALLAVTGASLALLPMWVTESMRPGAILGESRFVNFDTVVFTIRQYWPWGSGLGTFVPVFKANEDLLTLQPYVVNHAHNDIAELLIETGLPGAVLLIAAGGLIALRLWRVAALRSGHDISAPLAGFVLLALLLVHSLVDYPTRTAALATLAGIAAGLLFAPLPGHRTPAPARLRPPGRALLWAAWMVLAVVLAVQAVRIRAADGLVRRGNGALATAVRPQNGHGRALVAEHLQSERKPLAARDASIAALRRTPLSTIAVRTLAQANAALGRQAASEHAWQVAGMMGWRDRPTQVWALLRAASNGEAAVFAMRAEALFRLGDRTRRVGPIIRQAMVDPAIRREFVRSLAANPAWRERLFAPGTLFAGRELEGTVLALEALGAGPAPPTRKEMRGALSGLLDARRYAEAIALDRRFVRRPKDVDSLIDDGGFSLVGADYRSATTPFDWIITGDHAVIDETGRRSLVVNPPSGDRATQVQRYLALPAAAYRLGYATSGDADSPAAIGLQLFCAGSHELLATSSPEPLAGELWQRRTVDFTVSGDCPLVQLVIAGLGESEPAEVLLDDFSIVRVR